MWGAGGLIAPAIFAAATLPDNSMTWAVFAPLSFVCFVGWLIAGISMLNSWQKELSRADGTGVRSGRKSARARAARAGVWGLWAIVMPAAFCAWVIPGYTTVTRSVVIGLEVYVIFWLVGGAIVVASRRGWLRST